MPWKLYDTFTDGIDGQAVFSDAALKSADKKKQLEDIVGTLKDLNRAIVAAGGAVVFPRAKGGQNIAKTFVADAQKFIAGSQMKQLNGALKITKTENGVNPLCFGQTALLGCDVWEHSYYIDFRNKRPAYLTNFLDNLVNWENVAERLSKA